jgi:transcription elongation factor GreA
VLPLSLTTVPETGPLLFFLITNNIITVAMSKISYYTKDGLDKLLGELSELKTKGRADIARQIAEARDKGDLSENAEYDAAKDAQGHLEAKIAKLEDLVSNARLLDETNIDTSKVSILSKVTIKNKKNNASVTYTLVSEEEADLKAGKISTMSPIGKGLLGKKKGDVAKITTPAGEIEFEVVNISV